MGSSSLIGVLAVHADQVAVSLPASCRVSLVEALRTVPDRRDPRGVVHPLPGVLATAVAAVLAGALVAVRGRGRADHGSSRTGAVRPGGLVLLSPPAAVRWLAVAAALDMVRRGLGTGD